MLRASASTNLETLLEHANLSDWPEQKKLIQLSRLKFLKSSIESTEQRL